MALTKGTNQLRIQVIDSDTDTVKTELSYYELNYEQLCTLEDTILDAIQTLQAKTLAAYKTNQR